MDGVAEEGAAENGAKGRNGAWRGRERAKREETGAGMEGRGWGLRYGARLGGVGAWRGK